MGILVNYEFTLVIVGGPGGSEDHGIKPTPPLMVERAVLIAVLCSILSSITG